MHTYCNKKEEDDDDDDDEHNNNNNDGDVDDHDDNDGVDDVPVPSTSRSYRRFSAEEESALYLGVQRYGVGRWAEMLTTNDGLRRRSRIDLKDKWRTMVRQGRLEVLNLDRCDTRITVVQIHQLKLPNLCKIGRPITS